MAWNFGDGFDLYATTRTPAAVNNAQIGPTVVA